MSSKPHGLGKGLGALMGGVPVMDQLRKPVGYINDVSASARPSSQADVLRIPADQVEANPFQPRMSFNQESLEELADSIRTFGLIQPITVRRKPEGGYQIISGERRYRACRLAGMTQIPAYVRETDDRGMLEMAIVENIQREDLDPIEVALSYRRLMDECSLTQEQLSDRLGKKRATVANTLRLLRLPVRVQHDLKLGLISPGHAKALLGLEDADMQEKLCDETVRGSLSVRQLEELVRKARAGALPSAPTHAEVKLPASYDRLLSCMGRYFSRDISMRRDASGRGSMTVRFNSDEEVERFLAAVESL